MLEGPRRLLLTATTVLGVMEFVGNRSSSAVGARSVLTTVPAVLQGPGQLLTLTVGGVSAGDQSVCY